MVCAAECDPNTRSASTVHFLESTSARALWAWLISGRFSESLFTSPHITAISPKPEVASQIEMLAQKKKYLARPPDQLNEKDG
jgi:hypothetical protein